jgi:single-stranded-DNA-specific exonuclease
LRRVTRFVTRCLFSRSGMIPKQWILRHVDLREQRAFASLLAISPLTASVLLTRGITTKAQAEHWLSPHQGATHDPFLIPDIEQAVDRLHRAVQAGERICFYGDYDVDGMSATSLYVVFFSGLGANVTWYIPHRIQEGYGLNESAIARLHGDGVTLLVTSDCGTTAHREVEAACRLGLDVIITDHHQGEESVATGVCDHESLSKGFALSVSRPLLGGPGL